MLVRSNIQHVEEKIPMMYSLQVTAIMVELEGLETVIGAVYRSPSKPFVKADLDTLIGLSKNNKFIFGGDLNAKHQDWNSSLSSSSGKLLSRHADRNKYAISARDSPTYYPYRQNANPYVLDIFLDHQELPVEDVVSLDD